MCIEESEARALKALRSQGWGYRGAEGASKSQGGGVKEPRVGVSREQEQGQQC